MEKYDIDINEEIQRNSISTCAVLVVGDEVNKNNRIYSCAAVHDVSTCVEKINCSHGNWMTCYAHMHSLYE